MGRTELRRLLTGAMAVGLAVTPLAPVPAQAPARLPTTQSISEADRALGQKADPELSAEYGGVYSGSQSAVVRQVGLRVAGQSGVSDPADAFTFRLLNSGVPNAFAIPGGYAYITRGLLALMNNEAELGFVLGHETGHITARHYASRQKVTQRNVLIGTLGQTLLGAILGNGAAGNLGGQLGQAGIQRLVVGNVMSHSRADEFAADDLGLNYAKRAGYDPSASADILGALAAQSTLDTRIGGKARTTPSWAMSHPDPAARVVRARDRARIIGAGGTRNGDAFLESLDGLLYGDDPAQGVIEGSTFRYPPGRVQFTVPVGYGMTNGTDAVTITAAGSPAGTGQARFTGGNHAGDLAGMVNRAFRALDANNNAVSVTPRATRVNGMPAMTATTTAAGTNGAALDVTVVAIEVSPTSAYAFAIIQPRGRGLGDLAPLVNGFRKMTDAEVAAVRPRVIDVVSVGPRDSVATLAARMAFDTYKTERFLVLNNLPAGTTRLMQGRKVKLVVWGGPRS